VPELERILHLLQDLAVSDVYIDSAEKTLIEKEGKLTSVESIFISDQDLKSWVKQLFITNGSRLDIVQPISEVSIDTSLGLLRVHAVLAGECSSSTRVSIRRHGVKKLTLRDLELSHSITADHAASLRALLTARHNFVIVGGTGSGKTTLLRAMLSEVCEERVITIEENYELELAGNAIALKSRASNHEGVGAIDLEHLLRNALRMRPDRLVIGEARGSELLLLLQSLNTGHSGAGFTLHSNSHRDALSRMLGILGMAGVSDSLSNTLISSSINAVIELDRNRNVVAIERLQLYV
jgi:pilus assembly protein CpaF